MLKENDGLLANKISATDGISYKAALKKIKKDVKTLASSLNIGDQFTFQSYSKKKLRDITLFIIKKEESRF